MKEEVKEKGEQTSRPPKDQEDLIPVREKHDEETAPDETTPDDTPPVEETRLETLERQVEEMRSMIGRQAQELGDARNENAMLKAGTQPQQFQQPMANQPQNPYQPIEEQNQWTTADWENPVSKMEQIFDQRFDAWERRREDSIAPQKFEEGKRRAYEQNPELFKGIEQEVENTMRGLYEQGKGQQFRLVTADSMGNPLQWEQLAMNIKFQKEGMKAFQQPATKPVNVTETQTPAETKPPVSEETPIVLDAEGLELQKIYGTGDVKKDIENMKKRREDGTLARMKREQL
jgi:hypothetical protein